MTYSQDSSSDEGKLRLLIDDISTAGTPVVGTDYYFEDDDLTNILDMNGSDIWAAAADCCRRFAAKFAKEAFDLGLGKGDIKLDRRKKAEYYLTLAKDYDGRSGSDVVEFVDSYAYGIDRAGVDHSEYIGND